jgi:hypothetical protein
MPFKQARNDPGQDPPWAEENGSPVFQVGVDTISCERTIRCAWEDRFDVAQAFSYTGYEVTGKLIRGALECRDPIVIRGVARQGQAEFGRSEYEQATLQIRYASSDRHYITSVTAEPEFLTEDPKLFVWKQGEGEEATYTPILKGEAPGRLLFQSRVDCTIYPSDDYYEGAGAFPIKKLQEASGTVNSEMFILANVIAPAREVFNANTVLLSVGKATYAIDPYKGNRRWKVPLTFIYKPNKEGSTELGWNYFWRASTGKYERMYLAGSKEPHGPYAETDFSDLFETIMAYVPNAPEEEEEE